MGAWGVSRNQKIHSLQMARGLAAISVVLFHVNNRVIALTGEDVTAAVATFGNRGVDFFFVLSGFIMAYMHSSEIGVAKTWKNYVYKRFVRIYPIYWIYTASIVGVLVAAHSSYAPSSVSTWLTMILLVRLNDAVMPIMPAWTLFHEVLFYVLFSVLILSLRVGLALIALWTLGSCSAFFFLQPATHTPISVVFSPYNLNFIFGCVAFWLSIRLNAISSVSILLLIIFSLGFTALAVFLKDFSPCYGIGFAGILTCMVILEKRYAWYCGMLIGDASYSIYLTHEPILTLVQRILKKTAIVTPELMYIVMAGLAVIFGVIAYYLVERPVMGIFRRVQRA